MAYTLNMTGLILFPQSDQVIFMPTATMNESLIRWNYVTIPVPNRTLTLPEAFRDYPLWFRGYVADDFGLVGEAGPQIGLSNDNYEFYIGIDNVTLTYCLPCNFDILQQQGEVSHIM